MIIKKKYSNIKKISDELLSQNEVISEEKNEQADEELAQDSSDNVVTEPVEKKESKKKKNDFDLSLDDINFEPRQERREGSRRRGYRRTQDRNIISRAQGEAIAIREAAKNEGYKDGISKANKDIAELRDKFTEFYKYKEEVYEKVSECILQISVEIAKKIINKQVETDSEIVIPIIKNAIEEVNRTENKITLRVMPKDVQIVKDRIPEIFEDNYSEAKISVIPDKTITEGGVIVETSNGIVDASIQTQLAIIEEALIGPKEGS